MKIERNENNESGKFFIEENNKQIALMTYRKSGEQTMTIDHTEVDSNFRGEGLGQDLVAEAVKYARETGIKIVPVCSYAKRIFDKTPEYQDVIEK